MDNPNLQGPGLLFVKARISRPDILSEETYMKWYDDDHIAEILETSGIKSAVRYIRSDKASISVRGDGVLEAYPYLAMYPMKDLAFLKSEEFVKGIRVHSELLPGSGLVYDLADNEVRYYKLRASTEGSGRGEGDGKEGKRRGFAKVIVAAEVEGEGAERWIQERHVPEVRTVNGYERSRTYEVVFSRTNKESRMLKGLPVTEGEGGEEEERSVPTWLCVHEFGVEVDGEVMRGFEGRGEEDGKGVRMTGYEVARVHGEGDWFDEMV